MISIETEHLGSMDPSTVEWVFQTRQDSAKLAMSLYSTAMDISVMLDSLYPLSTSVTLK